MEVEEQWKDYLFTERVDALLFLVIPIAIREGWDIRWEFPVTELFLHNIEEFLIPAIIKGDARAKEFKIHAKH